MARPNFTECAATFLQNQSLIERYGWKGPVVGIPLNPNTQISVQGCKDICGSGAQSYPWRQIADTITTWVLPSVGVVVQAPFESNRNFNNMLCLARWVGSPIASLTAVLWNITVTGRCAMMVDMAISCQHNVEASLNDANFSDIRDSFYILAAMNQFAMMDSVRNEDAKKSAEGLLRVALFSRDLQLHNKHPETGKERKLRYLRAKTARYMRAHRKRGVIPVFISTLWFIVAMAISIQSAFGHIGENAAAHDLALGLLVAWLPLLIFATIVDRNFVSTKDVKDHLNKLVYETAYALKSPDPDKPQEHAELYTTYLKSLKAEFRSRSYEGMSGWEEDLKNLSIKCSGLIDSGELDVGGEKGFFRRFAGQGRIRRHYGAAHPILVSVEKAYIRQHGRNWLLKDESQARIHLVLKPRDQGLIWFDWRGLWQVLGSTVIVTFSVMGAFVLSFCVPTIGLGCRSGGYMIFLIIAAVLQLLELLAWAMDIHYNRLKEYQDTDGKTKVWNYSKLLDGVFFSVVEAVNTAWLINVILCQTVGLYETCNCQASTWSNLGGYIDFTEYEISDVKVTNLGWVIGTVVSCTVLGLTMIWIFVQWCIQSHLSTEDLERAKHGLTQTRIFLRFMWPLRWLPTSLAWTWQDGPASEAHPEIVMGDLGRGRDQSLDAPLLNNPSRQTSPGSGRIPDRLSPVYRSRAGSHGGSQSLLSEQSIPSRSRRLSELGPAQAIPWENSFGDVFNNHLTANDLELVQTRSSFESRSSLGSRSQSWSRSRASVLPR